MTPFVTALLVKVTLMLALALVAVAAMRSLAPALRHIVLLGALGVSLALPLLMAVSPQWKVALLPPASNAAVPGPSSTIEANTLASLAEPLSVPAGELPTAVGAIGRQGHIQRVTDQPLFGWNDLALIPLIWLAGAIAVVGWLTIGRARLDHIARMSWPLTDADWSRVLDEERNAAGVNKRVRLLSSPGVSTPLTWGWRTPVILLPEDALDWEDAHRRIVLRHELAHIARADCMAQLVAGIACAMYWFHPLVWIAERRMRAECERACDDTVVSHGTPAAEYAAHLLEVARSARSFGAPGFLSVAMARPSQLEGRLLAVLSDSRRRVSISRTARAIAALAAAGFVLPLAAFRAVPKPVTTTAPIETASSYAQTTSPATATAASSENDIAAASTQRSGTDTTFQLSVPATSGGTLLLNLDTGGDVIINSWDRAELLVRAALAGRDWRRTRVTLSPSSGGARLTSTYTGNGSSQSSRHTFEITVPRNYDVRISSAGGSVSLTGLNGRFSGTTGGGDIDIRNTTGEADIKTGGGNIHVRDSRLGGEVSTGGGTVRIDRVTGNLSGFSGSGPVVISKRGGVSVTRSGGVNIVAVNSGDSATTRAGNGGGAGSGSGTGSGSVTSTGYAYSTGAGSSEPLYVVNGQPIGGQISVNSAGGALSLPAAPEGARIVTGGGAIKVGPSAGSLFVSTGGGPIDVGPARGSVVAKTGAGDVTLQLEGASGHSVDVISGTGQVVLVVPGDLDAVLDLETAYTNNHAGKTKIVSDIPVQVTETANWDDSQGTPRRYVRTRQTVGRGGPTIRVRTVNGDIVLRRAK